MGHADSSAFADMCSEKHEQKTLLSFEFAEELLCGVLLHWPHRARPASLLLCGPSGHGKSYVVLKALQRIRGVAHHPTFTVTPQLAMSFSRRHADGSTALRRDLRRAIHNAIVRRNTNADGGDGDATVVVVLDHMELFITASNDNALSTHVDPLRTDQSRSSTPFHPTVLADLYDVIRGRDLFSEDELRLMRLGCVVFVTLFGGMREDIDPFARAKLFDAHVSLRTPSEAERLRFLRRHTALPLFLCQSIAARSGGITYRGLTEIADHAEGIAREAACMEEHRPLFSRVSGAADTTEQPTDCEVEAVAVALSLRALRAFRTSGSVAAQEYLRKAGYVDVQETRWCDVAGLESVKETLQQLVLQPLKFCATYCRFGVRPSTGVLLCGPPGTGKTLLARAMATELNASFVYLDLPQLIQAEVGESERKLREFFDVARERSPSVMFIDELQAAFGTRHDAQGKMGSTHDARLVTQLLHLLDKAQEDEEHFTLFVGATNVQDMVDKALLRAGRLDTLVTVPLPNELAREAIVRRAVYGEWTAWFPANVEAARQALVSAFVENTEGLSGAELRHTMNIFGLQLLRLAHMNADGDNRVIFRNLQELLVPKETCILSAYAQAALRRAIAGAKRVG